MLGREASTIKRSYFKNLAEKASGAPTDRRPFCDPKGNLRFELLQDSADEVKKALQTFPLGSSGGPDGLTAQHLKDLLWSFGRQASQLSYPTHQPHASWKLSTGCQQNHLWRSFNCIREEGRWSETNCYRLPYKKTGFVQTVTSLREEAKVSNQSSWVSEFQVAQKQQ